ncbi:MAG: hypothetical protein B6D64_05535 [Bacteroidetes bacterium 4484_276]|nr:MAG: hypothetical protein B6D64_05535 [Bacteroidetes bacterium 4484_276]
MNYLNKIGSFIKYDTFGALALANFLICVLSGVFLAIPFDVANPYESIREILLINPGAVFFRNIHYWSAQFFLVFTILHTWDYLNEDSTGRLKKGVWMRLVVSLLFVFYVMISGFILKADYDSLQARRIIDSLIMAIPWIGGLLSYSLLGPDESFQLLYVHHIATATIFLVIIIIEHAKTFWANGKTFFLTLILLSVISYFFMAPLHNNLNPVVKGPWYFLGLQEILHWMSRPAWTLFIIAGLLVLVYYMPVLKNNWAKYSRIILLCLFFVYMFLTGIAYFFRGENWKWDWQVQDVFMPFEIKPINIYNTPDSLINILLSAEGKMEGCLACHQNMEGFSPSHDPAAIGCASCHLGDPYTLDKKVAHRKMINIPGNLNVASRTCGTSDCHPEITERIQNTLMTTLSGLVSVDRFVFNEAPVPGILSHIAEIGHSAADGHLRDLCANCHLGNPKTEYGPINQLSRGGGCNACHLNYSNKAKNELVCTEYKTVTNTILMHHPELSLNITNQHCFGCHSRSGRIATNYEGWHETLLDEEEVTDWGKYRLLEDKRVFEFISADVHHESGMDCIDCHNSYETMGDGKHHIHEEFQVKIMCGDCHFSGGANTLTIDQLDAETYKILQLKGYPKDRKFLKKQKSGIAIVNTFIDEIGKPWLVSKNSGKTLPVLPPAEICSRGNAHDDLSCEACHTAWAPQCTGCHNVYEKNSEGYDLLENRFKTGTWVEYAGIFPAGPPALGVDERKETAFPNTRKIGTFINGMVLSIDLSSFDNDDEDKEIFHRLYAPTAAHTTSRKGRGCKSCHNDPLAIGYGRGKLDYIIEGEKGTWQFTSQFVLNNYDGLPEDAWIGFLGERKGWTTTREGVRPFTIEEQKRILTVGTCLTCHSEDSEVMLQSLDDFDEVLKRVSGKCVLVAW